MDYLTLIKLPAQVLGLFPYKTKNNKIIKSKFFSIYAIISLVVLAIANFWMSQVFKIRRSSAATALFLSKVLAINNLMSTITIPFCFYYYQDNIRNILNSMNRFPWSKTSKPKNNKYIAHQCLFGISLTMILLHVIFNVNYLATDPITFLFIITEMKFFIAIRVLLACLKFPELAFEEICSKLQGPIDIDVLRKIHLYEMKLKKNIQKLDHVFGIASLSIVWSMFFYYLFIEVLLANYNPLVLFAKSSIIRIFSFILDPIILMHGFRKVYHEVS